MIGRKMTARAYRIDDEGDGYGLVLIEDGRQVGGGLFPIDPLGEDVAYELAQSVGQSFVASARPRSAGFS